jgi:peptidylprolyl isomerase/FKBP-type peptidyl-prolyl cis-trans isomerase FklB
VKLIAALFGAALLVGGAAQAQGLAQTDSSAPAASTADVAQFLATNAKAPGVVVLPSGLQYKIVASGPAGGPSPKEGDVIKVQYEGSLTSGKVFDATAPGKSALMPFEGLIPAWMEAIPKMHVGDEWMIYAPPALGYGPDGAGPIPPNSVLVFKVKLVGMLSADDGALPVLPR